MHAAQKHNLDHEDYALALEGALQAHFAFLETEFIDTFRFTPGQGKRTDEAWAGSVLYIAYKLHRKK